MVRKGKDDVRTAEVARYRLAAEEALEQNRSRIRREMNRSGG